jgi:FixJ family two-component response regulator
MVLLIYCTEMSRRTTVAIVDDDSSVCKALGRLFRAAGIDSKSYPSAEEFLADAAADPDILVLDIQLPGISGIELQTALASSGRDIPIIFVTAHDEPELRIEAERRGCVKYLRKTDPGDSVLENIQKALQSRRDKVFSAV